MQTGVGNGAFGRSTRKGVLLLDVNRATIKRHKMMEITAVGMGLMMTAVAVAVGGLVLEATFLMLCRALPVPPVAHHSSPPPPI